MWLDREELATIHYKKILWYIQDVPALLSSISLIRINLLLPLTWPSVIQQHSWFSVTVSLSIIYSIQSHPWDHQYTPPSTPKEKKSTYL